MSYGPIRRATKKSSPPEVDVLSRPDCTQADDFVEMMQEVVPRLLASMPSEGSGSGASSSSAVRSGMDGAPASSRGHDTPRTEGHKRSASQDPADAPGARARAHTDEVLFCGTVMSQEHLYNSHVEALMAAYMQKKMQKELSALGNPPFAYGLDQKPRRSDVSILIGSSAVDLW